MPNKLQLSFVILVAASRLYGASGLDPATGVVEETKGQVLVGGRPAGSGASVTPGGMVATGSDSGARVAIHGSELIIQANTQLVMPRTLSGIDLLQGTVQVNERSGDGVRVGFPGAFVLIKGAGSSGALAEVATIGTTSRITVERGFAEIYVSGAPMLLHAGQWARLEATTRGQSGAGAQSGAPGQPSEVGKVTGELPKVSVQHLGQEKRLAKNDAVYVSDTVFTEKRARLQLTLLDGSTLDLCDRSEMRIVTYEPASQQTAVDLTFGKLRADVQRVVKDGGAFEVRTKTAVIRTKGPGLLIESDKEGTMTRICNGNPDVNDTSSSSEVEVEAIGGTAKQLVRLKRGECVMAQFGSATTAIAAPEAIARFNTCAALGAGTTGTGASPVTSSPSRTGLIVAVVAVGATLLGLGLAGTFSGGPSVTPTI